MDVEAAVKDALEVMEKAGVPADLRPTALPAIIELVASQAAGPRVSDPSLHTNRRDPPLSPPPAGAICCRA